MIGKGTSLLRPANSSSKVAKRPANEPKVLEVDLWAGGAESAEPREGAGGNTGGQHTCATPSRESVSQGLERVREAAKQRKKERFTALLHHVTIDLLKDAYSWLKREAAPGVDGRTWQSYKQNLTPLAFCATSGYLVYSSLAYTGLGELVGVLVLAACTLASP